MTRDIFLSTLSQQSPPKEASAILRALWLERQNQWEEAHEVVQDVDSSIAAAVHAYLHRKEGDLWNANYWYRTAGRKPFTGSLDDEWQALVTEECKNLDR